MTPTQVLGSLLILVLCPVVGGLPLIRWITSGCTGKDLTQLGTGNISVSAAFYHGGTIVGIGAVLSEALKGIASVLLARHFFPTDPVWELIALMALVMGRYWFGRGAGTTNVTWGYVVHDWLAFGLVLLLSLISFTIFREKRQGRLVVLVLLPLLAALLHPQEGDRVAANVILSGLIAWIYHRIPDDLDLSPDQAQQDSKTMFQFFRGDRAIRTLAHPHDPKTVGAKIATLAQLHGWGYPVPPGWVLPPGDDPSPLVALLDPSPEHPVIVRSSAIGEDAEQSSAAGQYDSIANVTSRAALEQAIMQCQASYNRPTAVQYRRDRGIRDEAMTVLVQQQVQGVFSGVAFSRDPVSRQGEAVVIEALPGSAARVVSGQVTPEAYRVWVTEADLTEATDWRLPEAIALPVEQDGEGDVPLRLIQQVAYLTRQLEQRYHGVPQDVEWSYDGQQLWVLQSRPITTLLPIWTRKIAAEVIPGWIRPLTWSINQPLTCGVWGDLFTVVLGDRVRGLDFTTTATLHHSSAYFNATLLGQLFRRMGLPPESLEFLTRGASFSKPPLASTLRNVPGLLRLLGQELRLEQEFEQDYQTRFAPALQRMTVSKETSELPQGTPDDLLAQIEHILVLLRRATYYSIMAPLSAALRQAMFKIQETDLDYSQQPEVAALRSLQQLAKGCRSVLGQAQQQSYDSSSALFASLGETPDGQAVLRQFQQFLHQYGYLSQVATDVAIPRWREAPQSIRDQFVLYLSQPVPTPAAPMVSSSWRVQQVQTRLHLKGRVTTLYSQLLAELRWCFLALERAWLESDRLRAEGDLFFLTYDEIRTILHDPSSHLTQQIPSLIADRRSQFEQDQQLTPVPWLVYGQDAPRPARSPQPSSARQLRGIAASSGYAEGVIKRVTTLEAGLAIDRSIILVVPYTDSGWSPLLARAGGIIAEVGGRLSHGAILAREYGIPAVMNVQNAMQWLQDGQRVAIDGDSGTVVILK